MRLYGPLIYHWSRRSGLQPSDAADIFQEVCCCLIRGLPSFREDPSRGWTFRKWLSTITLNCIRDYFRRLPRNPVGQGGTTAHNQFHQIADFHDKAEDSHLSEQNLLVHGALDLIRPEFSKSTWQAFWRVAIEGHSTDDVARSMRTTPSAIRQANYRVRRRLREELEDKFE